MSAAQGTFNIGKTALDTEYYGDPDDDTSSGKFGSALSTYEGALESAGTTATEDQGTLNVEYYGKYSDAEYDLRKKHGLGIDEASTGKFRKLETDYQTKLTGLDTKAIADVTKSSEKFYGIADDPETEDVDESTPGKWGDAKTTFSESSTGKYLKDITSKLGLGDFDATGIETKEGLTQLGTEIGETYRTTKYTVGEGYDNPAYQSWKAMTDVSPDVKGVLSGDEKLIKGLGLRDPGGEDAQASAAKKFLDRIGYDTNFSGDDKLLWRNNRFEKEKYGTRWVESEIPWIKTPSYGITGYDDLTSSILSHIDSRTESLYTDTSQGFSVKDVEDFIGKTTGSKFDKWGNEIKSRDKSDSISFDDWLKKQPSVIYETGTKTESFDDWRTRKEMPSYTEYLKDPKFSLPEPVFNTESFLQAHKDAATFGLSGDDLQTYMAAYDSDSFESYDDWRIRKEMPSYSEYVKDPKFTHGKYSDAELEFRKKYNLPIDPVKTGKQEIPLSEEGYTESLFSKYKDDWYSKKKDAPLRESPLSEEGYTEDLISKYETALESGDLTSEYQFISPKMKDLYDKEIIGKKNYDTIYESEDWTTRDKTWNQINIDYGEEETGIKDTLALDKGAAGTTYKTDYGILEKSYGTESTRIQTALEQVLGIMDDPDTAKDETVMGSAKEAYISSVSTLNTELTTKLGKLTTALAGVTGTETEKGSALTGYETKVGELTTDYTTALQDIYKDTGYTGPKGKFETAKETYEREEGEYETAYERLFGKKDDEKDTGAEGVFTSAKSAFDTLSADYTKLAGRIKKYERLGLLDPTLRSKSYKRAKVGAGSYL